MTMTDTRKELELRRVAACKDLLRGKKQAWVAYKYGVSRTTASRWDAAARSGQPVKSTRATGRPRKASLEDLLKVFLSKNKWAAPQELRDAIQERLGVTYHRDHLYRLIPRLAAQARRMNDGR